jgi:hypothetical protein
MGGGENFHSSRFCELFFVHDFFTFCKDYKNKQKTTMSHHSTTHTSASLHSDNTKKKSKKKSSHSNNHQKKSMVPERSGKKDS